MRKARRPAGFSLFYEKNQRDLQNQQKIKSPQILLITQIVLFV